MTWFKVDDQLAFHAKVLTAGNAAMGLWVRAGAWAAAHLTDGLVPNQVAILLCAGNCDEIDALVAANLWLPRDGGYQFHDWGDQQPSSHDVKERRRKEAERKAEARAKKRQVSESVPPMSHADSSSEQAKPTELSLVPTEELSQGDSQGVSRRVSALPDPTRPDPTRKDSGSHLGQEGGAGGEAPRKRSAADRGTRIPEDWEPTKQDKEWFEKNCLPELQGKGPELTEEFRDYWLARAGKEARKVDWSLTWKGRMRDRRDRVRERGVGPSQRGRVGVASPPRRSTTSERADDIDRHIAERRRQQQGQHTKQLGGGSA